MWVVPWWVKGLSEIAGKEGEIKLPPQQKKLSERTLQYEEKLRRVWEEHKPALLEGSVDADTVVKRLAEVAEGDWFESVADILGVPVESLTMDQRNLIQDELARNQDYLFDSLKPDLLRALTEKKPLEPFDYRVSVLYAGALWALGSLATVMFDGLSWRDLGDMFLFFGPLDERTCTGPRGCAQHVGKVYTVLQILTQDIIPGHLQCLHNCRHFLIPIASMPEGSGDHGSAEAF